MGGGLISTLVITAGISLLFNDWDGQSAKSKIASAIGGGLVVAGIIAKRSGATFKGSLLAFAVGSALTLSLKDLYNTAKDCGVDSDKFLDTLASGIVGAIVGFAISGGNISAGILGFSIGTELTLLIKDLIPDVSGVDRDKFNKDFSEEMKNKGIDPFENTSKWTTKYSEEYLRQQSQANKDYWSGIFSFLGGGTETETRTTHYDAPNTGSNVTTGTLTVSLDPNAAPNAWEQLVKQWKKIVSIKKVAEFLTKGIVNKADDWWKSTQGFWEHAIQGKNAKEFTIAGIVDKASVWWENVKQYWSRGISGKTASRFTIAGIWDRATTWWSEVKGYWSNAISGNTASRFTVEGIWNRASTWWSEVKGYWSEKISGQTASKFEVGGVKNQASTWWRDVVGYWSDATSGKTLKAKATISNAYNAFVSAFNTMQTNFNNHPLTAFVKTQTVKTTNISKAYQKKASGGIYKNGQWHDVTAFAAGGSPVSGQMFIAREAGPELVGSIGGNTAVVNNDQIVASVSAGVAQAVASVLGNGGNTNDITIKVDSEVLYRAVKKGERMASGRYGTAIAIG